eukprot:5415491-Pyramimonas_sp.AAC.1
MAATARPSLAAPCECPTANPFTLCARDSTPRDRESSPSDCGSTPPMVNPRPPTATPLLAPAARTLRP